MGSVGSRDAETGRVITQPVSVGNIIVELDIYIYIFATQ